MCFDVRSLAVARLDDLECRTIAPNSIDYNKLKDLVRICEKRHKRCCAAEPRPKVLGLEVIDTKTQEVIKAPDQCKYLALSYVWGEQSGGSPGHSIQSSPPVIKDAISVTNSMGYNYLWVDRYCISDPEERPRIISQMDQIYANASITIIAAADRDTEMGLCGVSMHRQLQERVDIQDTALLELPFGHENLTSSKWASRAWTYQEGYLSTRRLIFTNTQILFLCNGMYAAESSQQLLKANCYSDHTDEFKHLIPGFTVSRRRFTALRLDEPIFQVGLGQDGVDH
ncbi:HET-domain-containing protein [Diaporthe amygdali]|uniref:HET-domain-containing protein n=1 Tax=Phomopsis amygdali TaxID=1214568 RepID=UPI0022FE49D1|nr:HET-domain-containing protein [Diaporthe amygdali]KAJ0109926.1 HET-domain-containing protein [Diaporthe amygdali]